MKRRILIFAGLLLILTAWVMWPKVREWQRHSSNGARSSTSQDLSTEANPVASVPRAVVSLQTKEVAGARVILAGRTNVASDTNGLHLGSNAGRASMELAGLREQKAKAWLAGQKGRIDFWGRVLDQDDQPLAGVNVVMNVRQWRLLPASADFPKSSTKTDTAGNFQFLDASGDSMTIESIAKDGYSLSPEDKRRAIVYSYHGLSRTFVPDPKQPEIFKLRKQKGAEPMIHHEIHRYAIRVDGTPVQFDLRTGKKVATGGDFTIALVRDPETVVRAAGKSRYYSWRLILSAPGGGVMFRRDHFGYEAPADGYLESIETGQATDDPKWSQFWNDEIYCRNRAGQFCRLKVVAGTDGPADACLTGFECFLNPSGSRNLEFDSRLKIIPSLNPAQ